MFPGLESPSSRGRKAGDVKRTQPERRRLTHKNLARVRQEISAAEIDEIVAQGKSQHSNPFTLFANEHDESHLFITIRVAFTPCG